jgi:DNA-binding beta-propeller fold protein YncE
MSRALLCLLAVLSVSHGLAATFGTVTTIVGSVSDIVLDEERRRVYLVNSTSDRLEVYALNPVRQVAAIRTDSLPLSAAMSTDKSRLYITCHNSSSLNVVDLERLTIIARPSLPARPEGIAIGNDDRALITTIGTGVGNTQNTLTTWWWFLRRRRLHREYLRQGGHFCRIAASW